ncbi:MAG TPA: amidohydrolase family protein [Nocardioidaceae bacterium]|nr:amidohydrolase family protein [Nocardioidaceae bacterium]
MTTIFAGVSVVPMDSERVVEGQTVIVEGDRISWIGPDADAQISAGARRVDGRGKYLMPGLTDMHCHPGTEDDLLLAIAFGVTTIRNLEGLPRHVLWRDRIAAGELLGPTIFTTGPIVEGRPPRYNGMQSVVERDEAVAAVALTARGGYDSVKVYDQLTPEAYQWVVESARDHGLPVVGHIPFQVGLHGALAAGQRSIEHLYGYSQAVQLVNRRAAPPHDLAEHRTWLFDLAEHADTGRVAELAEATRAAGTWNCPTLIVRTRWAADNAEVLARPEMNYLSPLRAAMARYFMGHYPTDPARQAVIDVNAAFVRGLSDAGAGLLIGTDAGLPGVLHGAAAHEELKEFVQAGLTPYRALRAATLDAAAFVGEAGEWGQVSIGGRADLVLLTANPLDDVANAGRMAGVMVRGRWLSDSDIAHLLEDLAARQHALINGPPHAPMPAPVRASAKSELLRFDVTWDGFDLGVEHVVAGPEGSGRRRIASTASFAGGLGASETADVGECRSSVTIDAADVDRSAWFELDTDDGLERVELTRTDDGRVLVTHERPIGGPPDIAIDDPDARALLGRPETALYVRLAERLAGLPVGDAIDVPVIGPTLPPDPTVRAAILHALRLPSTDEDGDGPRYLAEFRRSNWTTASLLVCDRRNRPVRLEHAPDISYWEDAASTESPDPVSVISVVRAELDAS